MSDVLNNDSEFSMSCHEIVKHLSAQLVGDNVVVKGISTDTRKIQGGELFVALKGENFDGHDYVIDAMQKGAAACLVERDIDVPSYIKVENTLQAMGKLAKCWRMKFEMPVIAITGSNGKTTVKEMIASIASEKYKTLATTGNLNNEIGVPLTLFRICDEYKTSVIEMGANHPGEIAYLTSLTRPDIAVLTNAGAAHLEGFGSVEGVAKAKGEIFQGLSENGFAIINNDDAYSSLWKEMAANKQVLTFGIEKKSDVMATWRSDTSGSKLLVTTPLGECNVNLRLLGQHNIMNSLAAITASVAAGFSLKQITSGLESMQPVKGRLQLKKGINSSFIIDDTYNANPTSLTAALNVLHEFPGRHFLALGDMGELGDNAIQMHRDAGEYAKSTGVESLYLYGTLSAHAANNFGSKASCYKKQDEMIDAIKDKLKSDVTLLVKGSRRMGMENIVNALTVGDKQ